MGADNLDVAQAVATVVGTLDKQALPQKETEAQVLSRKEHFKPFNKGNAEWQYVEFQYTSSNNERVGITTSISELTNPATGEKTQQLLVMKHNLTTKTSESHTYSGTRTFDEATSTYAFTDKTGKQLANFGYNEAQDNYQLRMQTDQFNSGDIDPAGLILQPQGELLPVSKDGNFTVAAYEGGKVNTNYFADHIIVQKQNGEVIGYGRRDSENLEIAGAPPLGLDIDHTWVHASAQLEDGKLAFVTAWKSRSGGDFKFADVTIINPITGATERREQRNEDDQDFSLDFLPAATELEYIPGQNQKNAPKLAHGGKIATSLFTFSIDGDAGQIIDGKGFTNMAEAHGSITEGSILGIPISASNSAIWETTDETFSSYLSLTTKP